MPPEAQATFRQPASFIREGEKQSTNWSPTDSCPLNAARDWEMRVYLNQRLTFPPKIAVTNVRPDLLLWSKSCRRVFIVELTVPWEEAINEAFERKRLRYANLAAEAEDQGWNIFVHSVEVGCRGFVACSTLRLLKERGIVGQVQHGRGGPGLGATTPTWQKATPAERRRLVVEEVHHQEEADRGARAVSQAKQGCWMGWDGVERRKITWSELWNMESNMLSFTIRATYDVLPSPANLHL
ncbi:hypothetical protein D5F01_LYC05980 [Larimichthys crocea]|uniref:Uncharacterized protein n=1 Tax=Larimichthys crocea TaxID=215358 RepID=A0A6G0IUP6_LARCR|nr:hypothetical protein D5F01_LYC05980 [Larimichthys crocea]